MKSRRIRFYCGGHSTENGVTSIVDFGKYLNVMNKDFPEGCTLYRATGAWHGLEEPSFILETIVPSYPTESWTYSDDYILDVALALKAAGRQQEVLYTVEDVDTYHV